MFKFLKSPSSRGRGLKLITKFLKRTSHGSPSSRGRGLKFIMTLKQISAIRRPLHEGVD